MAEMNNKKKGLNVPPLRFPEFKGEWHIETIGNSAPLQRGFDLPESQIKPGNVPVVYSNGILRHNNEGKVEGPGVITGRSGTIGKFSFIESGKYWPHNTTLWVTDFVGNDPLFIYYVYQTISIEHFASGSGVPTLNRNDVMAKQWSLPDIKEQSKIAKLLSLIDCRIELQRKTIKELESFKAALSSKFISEADEKESIASLMESGLLREVKPSELKPFSGNRIYLSTSCIDGKTIISTEGSISYSFRPSRACMSPIKDSVWFAKMKNSVKVFRAQEGDSDRYVLSSGFTGLLSTTPLIDPNWLEMIFLSSEFNKQKNQMSEGGTMSGVKSGSFDELYIPYYSSTTSEQSCLVAWDKAKAIVDVESRKLVGLMKLREYCLTNLFA